MQHMPSSVVSSIQYDAGKATLTISFVSGRIYEYQNVPEDIFVAMKTSFSKGIYFNRHIKGNYPYKKKG